MVYANVRILTNAIFFYELIYNNNRERELNLNIKIVGKNIELGESFQAYSSARIGEILKKYSYDAVSAQITLEKRIGNFKVKLKVYLKNKIELDATGRGKDANSSYEDA